MKLELVKELRVSPQNTLLEPKSSWGSRETSLKSLALSGAFSIIFVTTLTYVPIFFFGMAKATSFWDQIAGCYSLHQNFIVYIADSGRRASRPGSQDIFSFMGSCQITLRPTVATEEFSSLAHHDNISPPWSSFHARDHLGFVL